METISSREDEVLLFDVLPESCTGGTSYDYYLHFPNFDEEFYYLLECATLQNADPEAIIKICREVQQERNQKLLDKFNHAPTDPSEILLDLEADEINYNIINGKPSADLPQQQ